MSEDAPVNIGAALERPFGAHLKVLSMQTKLQRWAGTDGGRRFDDVFNLVADPCFLVTAWMRVRENRGAKTAGIDRATVRSIEESADGAEGFLEELRVQLKARTFVPAPVRRAEIPKAGQRHTQKGSSRSYVYSYPSKKSMTSIRRRIKTMTTQHLPIPGRAVSPTQPAHPGVGTVFPARQFQRRLPRHRALPVVAGMGVAA